MGLNKRSFSLLFISFLIFLIIHGDRSHAGDRVEIPFKYVPAQFLNGRELSIIPLAEGSGGDPVAIEIIESKEFGQIPSRNRFWTRPLFLMGVLLVGFGIFAGIYFFIRKKRGLTISWQLKLPDFPERRIFKAIQFMHANFIKNDLDLSAVAKEVNLSPSYFKALFKKTTGKPFRIYLSEIRVTVAKKYLRETDASMFDIAEKVGFSSQEYFSKVFSKYAKISPFKYRQEKKNTVRTKQGDLSR